MGGAPVSDDAWERLRFMTIDQLVTETKLGGSASASYGRTTPEGWPFVVICAVASPGNEMALVYVAEFQAKMTEAGAAADRADNPEMPRCEGIEGKLPEGSIVHLHCPGCLEKAHGK